MEEPPSITAGQGVEKLSETLWAFETIGVTGEHKADENLKDTFGTAPTASFLHHACRGKIESSFAYGALYEADIIIVSTDTAGGLRGFCCVKKNYPKPGYLYVDLICSAPGPPREGPSWRAQMVESGRSLLEALKGYCTTSGWRGIFLRAVSNVITYYYYLGWRFIKNCGDVQKAWVDADQKKLRAFATGGASSDAIDEMAKKLFSRYGDFGWYKGITGAELAEGKAEAQGELDALGSSEFKTMTPFEQKLMTYNIPDQGYLMLWCTDDPKGVRAASTKEAYNPDGLALVPLHLKREAGGAIKGGRRRSRRKKKSRNIYMRKNLSTKTRKNRSRKKKRRRRRRGGWTGPGPATRRAAAASRLRRQVASMLPAPTHKPQTAARRAAAAARFRQQVASMLPAPTHAIAPPARGGRRRTRHRRRRRRTRRHRRTRRR